MVLKLIVARALNNFHYTVHTPTYVFVPCPRSYSLETVSELSRAEGVLSSLTTIDPLHALITDRDVAAVIHTATDVDRNPEPDVVVSQAINMTIAAMHAAAREPTVKRVLVTSSLSAVFMPTPGTSHRVGQGT